MFILILAIPAPCSNIITDTRRAVCLIQVKCDIPLCFYCHITRHYVNSINTALLIFWSFAWCIRDRFSPSFSVILLENNWYLFLAWLGQVLRNWTIQARYQYTLHWIEVSIPECLGLTGGFHSYHGFISLKSLFSYLPAKVILHCWS